MGGFFFLTGAGGQSKTQTNWQRVETEAEGAAFKWTEKEEPLSGSCWTSWHEQKKKGSTVLLSRGKRTGIMREINKARSRRGNFFFQLANEEQWESVDTDDEEPLPGSWHTWDVLKGVSHQTEEGGVFVASHPAGCQAAFLHCQSGRAPPPPSWGGGGGRWGGNCLGISSAAN